MPSCTTGSIECDDMQCGNRDALGLHWPAGHPQNREMKLYHACNDPATKGDIRLVLEAIQALRNALQK